MKILQFLFIEFFVLLSLFVNVDVDKEKSFLYNVAMRIIVCIISSFILTMIVGLPMLGILYLIVN